MTTYVFEGIEVVLTGRTAKKKAGRATSKNQESLMEIIYEIEPVDKVVNWQKWVSKDDMFEVTKP